MAVTRLPWWWRACYWIAGGLFVLFLHARDTMVRCYRFASGTLPGEVEAERRWHEKIS